MVGSSTEPDTPTLIVPSPVQFVFAHLIPSNNAARLAVQDGVLRGNEHHAKFVTSTKYRDDPSTPCFELALDRLPAYPNVGWSIGGGREDLKNMGVDLLLGLHESDQQSIAGVHARISWVSGAGGFFLITYNHRRKRCTVNGEDLSIWEERRQLPFNNTILFGELPFTLRYVVRDRADEARFQSELMIFLSKFHGDLNPLILPTPREADARFGEWIVQTPIARGTHGIVHIVTHSASGRRAAAKQLFKTRSNARSVDQEVRMAKQILNLSHRGIASPFDIRSMECQTSAQIAHIRAFVGHHWDPIRLDNITTEYLIFSPLLHADLRTFITSPNISMLSRGIAFAKILFAVNFLHEHGFCHRDLKPENILIETVNPPVPKITDFGCVSDQTKIMYDHQGTIIYLAPEQIEGEYHGAAVDYWACGLIGWELITHKRRQKRLHRGPQLDALRETIIKTPCSVKHMEMTCSRLLEPDPEDRMTANEAYNILYYRGGDAIKLALVEDSADEIQNPTDSQAKRSRRKH